MLILRKRRPALVQPAHGDVQINQDHFAARGLELAFVPRFGLVESVGPGRDLLAAAASVTVDGSMAGHSIVSEGTSQFYSLSTTPNVSRFTGDVSFLWIGVLTGAHTGDYPHFIGIQYGNGSGVPYMVAALSRGSASGAENNIVFHTNNGSTTHAVATHNASLSSYYGQRIAIAASQVAGANAVSIAWAAETSRGLATGLTFPAATPGNPRNSTANDTLMIGGYASVSTRHINARTAAAFAWSRALSDDALVRLVERPWALLEGPPATFAATPAPPPPPPPGHPTRARFMFIPHSATTGGLRLGPRR